MLPVRAHRHLHLHLQRLRPVACAAALLVAAAPSLAQIYAQDQDQADAPSTLQWRVGENVQRDSNVFRTPDNQRLSDTIAVTTLGLKLDKRYSLQRLELDLSADNYQYREFSQLNFNAVNYAGAWRWAVTPRLYGNVIAERSDYLDRLAPSGVDALNHRVERQTGVDAEYELGAAWHALAGVFERRTTNSLALGLEPDATVRGGEGGVRYVLPSGSSVAYRYRQGQGDYDSTGSLAPLATSDFKDREHEVELQWTPSAKTRVAGRLAYAKRAHDSLARRDFSGWRGRINGTWEVTGKTRVEGGLVRELASYQTDDASFYEGYRLFVGPVWNATEKIAVRLRYDHGERSYKGALPGFADSGRKDRLDVTTLALEWSPVRALRLVASWQNDQRRSNLPGLDYRAHVYSLAALASF